MTQQASGGDNRTPGKTIGQVKYADGQATAAGGEQVRPVDKSNAQKSQQEGPAYAPHEDDADASAGRNPATKKKKGESYCQPTDRQR